MRHSIFSVILSGIIVGALFFFMPKLVLGIFIFFFIIRLLHCACMGGGWYGHGHYGHHGYRHGYNCQPGCGYGDESYGTDCEHGYEFHHQHHHDYHHPMQGKMFYWADKIRNMSEEEYTEFKTKMDKGFAYSYHGSRWSGNDRCGRETKNGKESSSTASKEDATQNNESK